MDGKTTEVNGVLIELAHRFGALQLKLKEAEGEEYERLMKISKQLETLLKEMVESDDVEKFDDKVREAFTASRDIVK